MKQCTGCGASKPLSDYYKQSSQKSGLNPRCKPCVNALNDAYAERNKERTMEWRRRAGVRRWAKVLAGISREEFEAYVVRAGGHCEVCGRPETTISKNGAPFALALDHDHRTATPRGMLCRPCNMALGCVQDDPSLLRRLAEYVESPPPPPAPLSLHQLGGWNHSLETRARIAATAIGNQRTAGLKHPPRSPEWLAKQSEAQKRAWARRKEGSFP